MATQMSLLQVQETSMEMQQSTFRPSQTSNDRQREIRRLATFRKWPQDMPRHLSKSLLAKLGFIYTSENEIVKCDGCQLEIDIRTSTVNLQEEHQRRSPQCPFVISTADCPVQTDTALPHLINRMEIDPCPVDLGQPKVPVPTASSLAETEEISNEEDPHTSNELRAFLRSVPEKILAQLRETTLSNWPLITPTAQDMARAGWWYTNMGDRVICIRCHKMCHKWTNTDLPFELHEQMSPSCPFVQAAKKQLGDSSKSKLKITTEPKTQVMPEPFNAIYAPATRRYDSFEQWPKTQADSLPSVESFVDAGFFYTGELTVVRCFFCNGALRNWQSRDDPKIEHARWFPQCAYIRQLIGEDLYEAVQRKNRELKAQQNSLPNSKTGSPQAALWSHGDLDRMVKARLDLAVVVKLQNIGYKLSIIKKCIEMQLQFKKDDFKTDADLQIAYFVLEQQVKLINGNEGNIIIPANWVKTVIETAKPDPPPPIISLAAAREDPPEVTIAPVEIKPTADAPTSTTCLICLSTERQIACLPCGHLTSCVVCGHSLKTCPLCRAVVKGYIRIYL